MAEALTTQSVWRAQPDDRLSDPAARPSRARRAATIIVAMLGASLLHGALLLSLLFGPQPAAVEPPPEAIPVEIIQEPAPPPPPDPPPMRKLDDTIATDAPLPPPRDATQRPSTDEAASAPSPAAESRSAPETKAPRPTATTAAAPEAAHTEPDGSQPATAAPPPGAGSALPRMFSVPAFSQGPAFDPGAIASFDTLVFGKAKSTYLAAIYGRIIAHAASLAQMPSLAASRSGEVDFALDGAGRLVRRTLVASCGDATQDRVAFEAVGAAAPYPAPPDHEGVGMRFVFTAR